MLACQDCFREIEDAAALWCPYCGASLRSGNKPPSGHPVYVLTHHSRQQLSFDNGTTFTFACI
jgi:hypothetical protein